jgi:Uma2 family endonuclease
MTMTTLIADAGVAERLIAERRARGWDRKDEVWDGVYIIMPDPNVEHQFIVMQLGVAFSELIKPPAGGKVFPGLNLSDRTDDWKDNYRCPDVAVFLADNTAEVFEAHICGPADFLVEIVSPGDKSRDKLEFYAELGVRELLVIDRYPWSLELYRLSDGQLILTGRSTVEHGDALASTVLPVSFQLIPAQPRPEIRIMEVGGTRTWTA